jgi:hypothetical protein
MKKILFGSAAAILAVVGLSSFKATKKLALTKYYFTVNPDKALGSSVAVGDVSWLATSQSQPGDPCDDVLSKICVIGVTVGQVTTINKTHLKASQTNKTIFTRSAQ